LRPTSRNKPRLRGRTKEAQKKMEGLAISEEQTGKGNGFKAREKVQR